MSFSDLMNKAADEVEAPKSLPVGTYGLTIVSTETGKSRNKGTDYLRVNFKVLGMGDDIDADMIADAGGEEKIVGKSLRADFYITEDALYRLSEFVKLCGFDTEGKTLGDLVPELPGCEVNAFVTQRPNEDGSRFYNDIQSFAAVD